MRPWVNSVILLVCVLACCVFLFAVGHWLFVPPCGRQLVKGPHGQCVQCMSDSDCGSGQLCEPSTFTCVECMHDNDCPSGTQCASQRCARTCTDAGDCASGACDTDAGVCTPAPSEATLRQGATQPATSTYLTQRSCLDAGHAWGAYPAGGAEAAMSCAACDPTTYMGPGYCSGHGDVVACLRDSHCGGPAVCDSMAGVCRAAWYPSPGSLLHAGGCQSAWRGRLYSPTRGAYLSYNRVDGITTDATGDVVQLMWFGAPSPAKLYVLVYGAAGWFVAGNHPGSSPSHTQEAAHGSMDVFGASNAWDVRLANAASAPLSTHVALQAGDVIWLTKFTDTHPVWLSGASGTVTPVSAALGEAAMSGGEWVCAAM